MSTAYNPSSIAAPFGSYSHAVEIEPGMRVLHVSGQLGVNPDGTIPDSFEDQSECVWHNIVEILKSADMDVRDIVKMTSFLVRQEDVPKARVARSKYLGEHRPASTAAILAALVKPELLIEVEVVAAKAQPTSATKPS